MGQSPHLIRDPLYSGPKHPQPHLLTHPTALPTNPVMFPLIHRLLIPSLILFLLPERPFPAWQTAIHSSKPGSNVPLYDKAPPWGFPGRSNPGLPRESAPHHSPHSTLAIWCEPCSTAAEPQGGQDARAVWLLISTRTANSDITYTSVGAQSPLWERGWGWERVACRASQEEGDSRQGLGI